MTDEICDTGALGRVQHGLGFGGVQRERLFAEHSASALARFNREQRMRVGRCCDRDRIHIGGRECAGDGRARVWDPGTLGAPSRAFFVATDERADVEPCSSERRNVHPASEAAPYDNRAGHA